MTTQERALSVGGALVVWGVIFLIWLAASASLEPARLATGLVVSALIAGLALRYLPFWRGLSLAPRRLIAGITFLGIFCRDMILSNFAVLRYVYAPRITAAPTVIPIEIHITGPRERLLLTNALALTPGTLVIDLHGNMAHVHLLDGSLAEAAVQSVRSYERLLEVAFG